MAGLRQILAVEADSADEALDMVEGFLESVPSILDTHEFSYDLDDLDFDEPVNGEDDASAFMIAEVADEIQARRSELRKRAQEGMASILEAVYVQASSPDFYYLEESPCYADTIELLNLNSGVYRCAYPFYDVVMESYSVEHLDERLIGEASKQWLVVIHMGEEDDGQVA